MKTTKVKLREKKISKNRKSLYLDYYPPIIDKKTGKSTRREFLRMYIFEKPRNPVDKQHNKEVKVLAENIRAQRQIDIQKSTFGFIPSTKSKYDFIEYFSDIVRSKYSSLGNYGNWRSTLLQLESFRPNGITMENIDTSFVIDFKIYLENNNQLKPNTKVSYYAKFSAALKQAVQDGYLEENPAKGIKAPKGEETRREILTFEEIQKLAATECKNYILKKAFLFSAFTGLRFIDLKELKWDSIEKSSTGTFIRFKQKKTGGEETTPISNTALDIINDIESSSELVFEGLQYASYHSNHLKKWIKEAGIKKKISFHNARHSFATLMLTLGSDIYTVSKLLGHKEVKTTQIYAKIIDQKKIDAVNKLNDLKI
jgi:integrase